MAYADMYRRLFDDNGASNILKQDVIPVELLGSGVGTTTIVSDPVCNFGEFIYTANNEYSVSAVAGLPIAKIHMFNVKYTDGTRPTVLEAMSIHDSADFTIPLDDTYTDKTITVEVEAVDTLGNKSTVLTHTMLCKHGSVIAPTILSPAANATVINGNITVITSAFSSSSADTHVATECIVETAAGVVLYNSGWATTTLTTLIIPTLSGVKEADVVFIKCRHKGAKFGASEYSALVPVSISLIAHGARVDNKATIIGPVTYAGASRYIAVVDAAHRHLPMRVAATYTPLFRVAGYEASNVSVTKYPDPNTAKKTTDHWISADSNNGNVQYACGYCRSVKINGTPCDWPTVTIARYIYRYRAFLDSVDPTVATSGDKSMAAWGGSATNGGRPFTMDSTGSTYNGCVTIVETNGTTIYADINHYIGFIIPVLEL